ncbi:MAG: CsiV family protein [Aestuariibacter sp.]
MATAQTRQPGDPWWFEVEALFFTRDVTIEQLQEKFIDDFDAIESDVYPSFVRSLLAPDIRLLRQSLPICSERDALPALPLQTVPAPEISQDLIHGDLNSYLEKLDKRIDIIDNLQLFEEQQTESMNSQDFARSTIDSGRFDLQSQNNSRLNDSALEITEVDLNTVDYTTFNNEPPVAATHPPIAWLIADSANAIVLPEALHCQWPVEAEVYFDDTEYQWRNQVDVSVVPRILNGIEFPFSEQAYVLPDSELELTEVYRHMRNSRDLKPLLHMAWRQNVATGRDNAPFYHIFAGQKFVTEQQKQDGIVTPQPTFDDPLAVIEYALSEDFTVQEQQTEKTNLRSAEWPIDGLLKVFIEYIGGTPYLHIDSIFDVAVNNDANTEQHSLRFSQLRRVISTEIHYFDHPAFGFVIQVRRYERPEPESDEPEITND